MSFSGRCYLVALEHVRGLAPDEAVLAKPIIRQGLEQLRQAAGSTDFTDLSRQVASPEEVGQALEAPAGNGFEAGDVLPPEQKAATG